MVTSGKYVVAQAILPGRPVQNVGIFLHDLASDQLHLRFVEDWADVGDPEDAEVFALLEKDLKEKAKEYGSGRLLQWLLDTCSNTLRLTEPCVIPVTDFQITLNQLFELHTLGEVQAGSVRITTEGAAG